VVPTKQPLELDSSDKDVAIVPGTYATTQNNSIGTATGVNNTTIGKHGPVYIATEELMSCKAFIATS
jgi:hypothetical protein